MEKRMNVLKNDLEKEGFKDLEWGKLEKVLDGEWDENVWEKIVGGMLSKGDEQEDEDDDEKPTWDDELGDAEYDEDEGEGDFKYEFANGEGEGMGMDIDEDEGPINMDADFMDEEPSKKSKKKDKKKNKNKERSPTPLPEDEENQLSIPEKAHALKQAVESYNALAHEDIIDDMLTRFKYTPSAPASFGLTPVEILLATDDELNKLVTMKGIAPYRKGGIGMQGKGLGKRVRELKDKLRERRWGEELSQSKSREEKKEKKRKRDDGEERGHGEKREKKSEGEITEKSEKVRNGKRLGKKERMRLQKAAEAAGAAGAAVGEPESVPAEKKRKVESSETLADAPGANGEEGGEKKKRRKKKKSKADGEAGA